jgi:hypothetical protein
MCFDFGEYWKKKSILVLDHWEAKFYDLHMAIRPQAKHSCITGGDKCQRSY